MTRRVSPDLLAHLQQAVTTTCRLLKITLRDGRSFGMTTLDRDVIYDGVAYSAINGFDPSIIATDASLSVDNAEGRALVAEVDGITDQMVLAGELDDAQWQMMLINWADLSMGDLLIDFGDVGQVELDDGMIYIPELLSFKMRLRQLIGIFTSRTCRATFGTPPNSHTGCGVDAEALFTAATVTGVQADDPFRVFAAAGVQITSNTARVRFTSGKNSGSRLYQVEGFGSVTNTIVLSEPAPFIIQEGDLFEWRPDCDKQPNTCKNLYDNFLNYKGESLIPVGEGAAVLTPQASIQGGFQGSEVIE